MASLFEVTAGGKIGYVSGGSVTQGASLGKTTGVTLNAVCGAITCDDGNVSAAAESSFTVTNDKVAAGDVVLVNHASAGTAGAYLVQANSIAAGSFKITIANLSSGTLGEAIVLNFVVIKGASS